MVGVARDMQRRGIDKPLLSGGATTSKAHTAVKVEPAYNLNQVVYVPDASRSVSVVSNLLSDELRDEFVAKLQTEYEAVRVRNANRKPRGTLRSEEHTSELQSRGHLVCRLLLERKKRRRIT